MKRVTLQEISLRKIRQSRWRRLPRGGAVIATRTGRYPLAVESGGGFDSRHLHFQRLSELGLEKRGAKTSENSGDLPVPYIHGFEDRIAEAAAHRRPRLEVRGWQLPANWMAVHRTS